MLQDDNNYTIEVIAKESGFQSLSTFRRAFVKQVGVTPSKYRKQIKG
jgi:AraC-like DNA-binding protein